MVSPITNEVVDNILGYEGFPLKDLLGKKISNIISKEAPEVRERIYTPEVTFLGMVYGALDPNSSLRRIVIKNNADRVNRGLEPASINTAAFSKARDRLPTNVLKESAKLVAYGAERDAPEDWSWHGLKVFALDGSTITAEDTPENQSKFPQHGKQEKGIGFPIIRLLILQSITTGMIHDLSFGAFKGKKTGEMSLARKVLDSIAPNSLLLGDRYYPSFFFMCDISKRGIKGLFQSHALRNVDFRRGEQLGELDHIVSWSRPQKPCWMSKEEYNSYPSSIKIRELDIAKEIGSKQRFVVVTTLLDSNEYNKEELGELYLKRWGIELALRNLKDTMGMGHLNAKTPDMIEKVLWSYIMAFNGVRWYMGNAAAIASRNLDSISFKVTHDTIEANKTNLFNTRGVKHRKVLVNIFVQILSVEVGNRKGRSEPRVVKKRPKPHVRMSKPRSEYRAEIQGA